MLAIGGALALLFASFLAAMVVPLAGAAILLFLGSLFIFYYLCVILPNADVAPNAVESRYVPPSADTPTVDTFVSSDFGNSPEIEMENYDTDLSHAAVDNLMEQFMTPPREEARARRTRTPTSRYAPPTSHRRSQASRRGAPPRSSAASQISPAALIGLSVAKYFPSHGPGTAKKLFVGKVTRHELVGGRTWWRVVYDEDDDEEDMNFAELCTAIALFASTTAGIV